jgi:hypothetical protein
MRHRMLDVVLTAVSPNVSRPIGAVVYLHRG